ncbi:Neurobeachin [Gryllus bimaculatus]|nr:Neurobeachin [Gryllus bimaculatus]
MESRKDIYHLWVQYTTKNEEEYFRKFIKGFVGIWESQLALQWTNMPEWSSVRPDAGPHLTRLPEELLPAIGKFMYIAKDQTEKKAFDLEALKNVDFLIRCMIVICRNFDNIPFIASCEYVSQTVGIAAAVIQEMLEGEHRYDDEGSSFIINFCHLLECLYDPYLTWRSFLKGSVVNFEKLAMQPALLHVEVVPFIYDCSQTKLVESSPQLSAELLNVLGAVISGARSMILKSMRLPSVERKETLDNSAHPLYQGHNALRAICPATVNVVMSVIACIDAAVEVRRTAIQCFVMMVKVLDQCSPDQRQIEIGTILLQYKEPLLELASQASSNAELKEEKVSRGEMLGDMVAALRRLLQPSSSSKGSGEHLRRVMVDNQMLEVVLSVLDECVKYPEKQKIATICVSTVSSMLHGSLHGKERMLKIFGYDRLLVGLAALDEPSREPLEATLAMASGSGSSHESKLKVSKFDADALLLLVSCLGYIGREDQLWLTGQIAQLCSADLQSKHLACRKGVILEVCHSLSLSHTMLNPKAVNEMIKLLEVLASHSITSYELKELFLLLREDGTIKFPYRLQLLHTISSVARKDDFMYSHSYFDIQKDTDGITVPGIRKWAGGGAGFSFHCWLRLDEVHDTGSHAPIRRQLFSLLTGSGVGLEAFFHNDGCLVVSVNSKKECYTACVADFPLVNGLWHSIGICHAAARRPFGQNQLSMYIDGVQRMAVTVKSPSMTDAFLHCVIGTANQRVGNLVASGGGKSSDSSSERGLLPTLINQVPSYLTLPLRSSAPLDPNVRSFPAGAQDSVWGTPGCLKGQLGTMCLFQEALTSGHIRTLHDGGPNCKALFWQDEMPEFTEICSKLVFCYSPSACWDNVCLDLSPACKFSGHAGSSPCHTTSIKNVVNGIGGVQVLLPILEAASSNSDEGPDLSFLSPSVEKELKLIENRQNSGDSEDDWEILPSSSYSDWKLEQNPISGFLSLLKNMVAGSAFNQEQLLSSKGLALVGSLMAKARPELIDVNVLMAVQLLVEMARERDASNLTLLRSIHQYILFNFAIWSRAQFHIMIGHVQYLSTIIKEDRKYFRKKFGIPFVLSVVHRYHAPCTHLTEEEGQTVRQALFGLIRYYLSREASIREITAIIGFLCAVTDENVLTELVEMLSSHLESKNCRDQTIFLLYEQHHAELLHCLVVECNYGLKLKYSVLKLIGILLKSDLVFERNKARLRLQDSSLLGSSSMGLYAGMVACLRDQPLSKEIVGLLLDHMLQTDSSAGFAGALALLHNLSGATLDLKLEAARKVLTNIFMKVYAPRQFAKQVGWQECVTRLLVKQPIVTGALSDRHFGEEPEVPPEPLDLMTFDEERLELEPVSVSSTTCGNHSPNPAARLTSHVSDAAMFVEHEIKEVAETVTNAVAGNINYAADNISSVVASAYSVFRQKTVEMQESLEELGESVSRLKQRRSLASLSEEPSEAAQASPRLSRMQLPVPGLDLDSISLGNRSQSSSSTEDLSSPHQGAPDNVSRDSASLASVPGVTGGDEDEDDSTVEREDSRRASGESVGRSSHTEGGVASELPSWRRESIESPGSPERMVDEAEELSYLVANILFTVMWRGVEGSSKDAWKERGQVMACINLLGLNNELHCSHLQLKLRLLELATAAALGDLRGEGELLLSTGTAAATENAAQLIRWAYDLMVLDPHDDMSKKSSVKLLDGVLGLLDAMLVFQEAPGEEWGEMAKLAFGILLSCAACDNLELCAIATAKLHALVQTRNVKDLDEAGYLLYSLNKSVEKALDAGNQEHYSFLIPVVKALLEKLSLPLNLVSHLPDLPQTQAGPAFFDDFQQFCKGAQWKTFVERKVNPAYLNVYLSTSDAAAAASNSLYDAFDFLHLLQ